MIQTIEAVIDEQGKVQLLQNVRLPQVRRALVTTLHRPVRYQNNEQRFNKWLIQKRQLRASGKTFHDKLRDYDKANRRTEI